MRCPRALMGTWDNLSMTISRWKSGDDWLTLEFVIVRWDCDCEIRLCLWGQVVWRWLINTWDCDSDITITITITITISSVNQSNLSHNHNLTDCSFYLAVSICRNRWQADSRVTLEIVVVGWDCDCELSLCLWGKGKIVCRPPWQSRVV